MMEESSAIYASIGDTENQADMIEWRLWNAYNEELIAKRARRRFEIGFKLSIGALMAIVFAFDAWLVWMIFF